MRTITQQETVTQCLFSILQPIYLLTGNHIKLYLFLSVDQSNRSPGFLKFQLTKIIWLWRWHCFRTGCWNVSCHQGSLTGLQSPRWPFPIEVNTVCFWGNVRWVGAIAPRLVEANHIGSYQITLYSRTSIIRTIQLSGLFSLVPIFSWILTENSFGQQRVKFTARIQRG